jgi:hypothetical protein
VSSTRDIPRWRSWAIAGPVALIIAALAAPAAAEGGHLPGFSVADHKVAIAKLPTTLKFIFGGFPGAKAGLPHVGKGPVWLGEVQRPKRTIYVAGDRRWVCASEAGSDEDLGGGASCTTPAAAREFGLVDVGACGKGPPRHFRVYGVLPDGVTELRLNLFGGAGGRTVPVIENTFAFTIGRENFVLQATGDAAAEELHRILPLARTAEQFRGNDQAGCSSYIFAEARKPDGDERAR